MTLTVRIMGDVNLFLSGWRQFIYNYVNRKHWPTHLTYNFLAISLIVPRVGQSEIAHSHEKVTRHPMHNVMLSIWAKSNHTLPKFWQYNSIWYFNWSLRRRVTVDFVTSEHSPTHPVPYCRNFIPTCSERSFWAWEDGIPTIWYRLRGGKLRSHKIYCNMSP